SWLAPADLVEALASVWTSGLTVADASRDADWLEEEVLPRLDDADMEEVRDRLRALMRSDHGWTALRAPIFAPNAGLGAAVLAFLRAMKRGKLRWAAHGCSAVAFAIKDPAALLAEFRRLELRLLTPTDARVWLALTGHDGLDVLRESVLGQRKAAEQLAM